MYDINIVFDNEIPFYIVVYYQWNKPKQIEVLSGSSTGKKMNLQNLPRSQCEA